MRKGAFEVLVNICGKSAQEYSHNGECFICAEGNTDYSIDIRSHIGRKSKVVLSVDGLDVMTGLPANTDAGGYIIPEYGHIEIPGWRLDNERVAKFRFGYNPYAEYQKTPNNIGVIGAAFFLEKEKQMFRYSGITKGCGEGMKSFGIGTEFGSETNHHVRNVDFEAEKYSKEIITIRYDTQEKLESAGIIKKYDRMSANPFPGGIGCTPPYNWRR